MNNGKKYGKINYQRKAGRKMKKVLKAVIISLAALLALIAVFTAGVNLYVVLSQNGKIVSAEDAEKADFILILGCGVHPDGTPSDMLRDRLLRGVELYKSGASDKILVTGDHKGSDYNEVDPMIDFCVAHGVPREDILSDDFGVSTFESLARAKSEFGAESLIVVTQKYHLYRALYIAGGLEMKATGVSADLHRYAGQTFRDLRELPARVKDFLLVIIK